MFITFEGIDGSGKSTQVTRLAEYLRSQNYHVEVIRDPGSTKISESIRNILLSPENKKMNDITELLLYAAARSQMVAELILPTIEKGGIVLSDRFYDSTTCYQGFGRKINMNIIHTLNKIGAHNINPDCTFLMDIPVDTANTRVNKIKSPDRMEQEHMDFKTRVRQGFLDVAAKDPSRFTILNSQNSLEQNHNFIIEKINEKLSK